MIKITSLNLRGINKNIDIEPNNKADSFSDISLVVESAFSLVVAI